MKKARSKTTKIIILILLAIFSVFTPLSIMQNTVSASPVVGFKPGFIISDNIFTNYMTMSPGQIQSFLLSKVPVCDTWGTGGSTPTARRDYIRSYGYDVPLKCLIDYTENGKSAAQIIYDTAQKYQINPQVLLVLLQKEQGLVTDDWPGPWQYKKATGYGCPDTAPCDSQYYGFTNQLDWSAKMFRAIMNNSPTWYTPYVLGNNFIKYNPNASCGGTTVNIQNRATQALYNYTPYQPNQAALNAGYGTGDSCSAYGNRNFYQYFTDWFGSPQFGNLVRTVGNATVYLVSGDNKYPIADINILGSLGPFGGVSYVKQSYLDDKITGNVLGRAIISGGGGTVYYFSSGIKLPFTSCSQVADYGYDCGQVATLTGYQINALYSGPTMTSVLRTTNGKRFYIKSGEKKEVFDDASLQANGVPLNANLLGEASISNLIYGTPVVRDNVVAVSRNTGKKYLTQGSSFVNLPLDIAKYNAFSKLTSSLLDDASIVSQTVVGGFSGFAQDSTGNKYVIDSQGKSLLLTPENWTNSFTLLDDALLGSITNSAQSLSAGFIKTNNNATLYMVIDGKKYSIPSWGDFINLHLDKSASYAVIADTTKNSIPIGANIYSPGALIKTSNNATVYVINGILSKIALSSFNVSKDFGLDGVKVVPQKDLEVYVSGNGQLTNFVTCDGNDYLANRGKIYEIDSEAASMYGYGNVIKTTWDSVGCSNLNKSGTSLSNYSFIKIINTKTIYYLQNGQKRPIGSMEKYSELGGSSDKLLIVSAGVSDTISDGSPV